MRRWPKEAASSEETPWRLRDIGSALQGPPDLRKTAGIDMTTGLFGQDFSCTTGTALGGKPPGQVFWVYVVVGDGEIQEGVVGEAAMAVAHYKLNNLVAIVGKNLLLTP